MTPLPRLALFALAAALPAAGCASLAPPVNPFAGAWATAERQQITFRDNTVVLNPGDAAPTAMGKESCAGTFRFGYRRESRAALLALMPHQPDLEKKLAGMLQHPDYAVAELACGDGDSTYVLLDDRDVLAIHRDQDIAGIERLTRL